MDQIKQLILSLGIRSTYRGFHYLCYALSLCLQNEDYLLSVYTLLYPATAEHFNANPDNVEHCLRTVIAYCWNKGNKRLLIELAGYELTEKPTNGEFLDILYQHLIRQ